MRKTLHDSVLHRHETICCWYTTYDDDDDDDEVFVVYVDGETK